MSNFANIRAKINAWIKYNNHKEITASQLNEILQQMVDDVVGYQYKGLATSNGTPTTGDSNDFYMAVNTLNSAVTYTNYGGLVVSAKSMAFLKYNGSWTKDEVGIGGLTRAEADALYLKLTGGQLSGSLAILGNGNLGVGASPSEKLDVVGGVIRNYYNGFELKIGSQNSSFCHIHTTAPQFSFNKPATWQGHLRPYTDNAYCLGSADHRWQTIYADKIVTSGKQPPKNILYIGSSHGRDTIGLFPKLAYESGMTDIEVQVYYSGGVLLHTIASFCDDAEYINQGWRKVFKDDAWTAKPYAANTWTMAAMLTEKEWDCIFIQRAASEDEVWNEQTSADLTTIVSYIKSKCTWQPRIIFSSGYSDPLETEEAQEHTRAIMQTAQNARYQFCIEVLPTASYIQQLRNNPELAKRGSYDVLSKPYLARDAQHLDEGIGLFCTACLVYQYLYAEYGKSVYDFNYSPQTSDVQTYMTPDWSASGYTQPTSDDIALIKKIATEFDLYSLFDNIDIEYLTILSSNLYNYARHGVQQGVIKGDNGTIVANGWRTGLIPVLPNHYYYLNGRRNDGTASLRVVLNDGTYAKVLIASTGIADPTYWYLATSAGNYSQNGQFKTPPNAKFVEISLTPSTANTPLNDRYCITLEDVGNSYNSSFAPMSKLVSEKYIPDAMLETPVAKALAQLDGKVDKEEGKGLSTNDYTDGDKWKVDNINRVLDSDEVDLSQLSGYAMIFVYGENGNVLATILSLLHGSTIGYLYQAGGLGWKQVTEAYEPTEGDTYEDMVIWFGNHSSYITTETELNAKADKIEITYAVENNAERDAIQNPQSGEKCLVKTTGRIWGRIGSAWRNSVSGALGTIYVSQGNQYLYAHNQFYLLTTNSQSADDGFRLFVREGVMFIASKNQLNLTNTNIELMRYGRYNVAQVDTREEERWAYKKKCYRAIGQQYTGFGISLAYEKQVGSEYYYKIRITRYGNTSISDYMDLDTLMAWFSVIKLKDGTYRIGIKNGHDGFIMNDRKMFYSIKFAIRILGKYILPFSVVMNRVHISSVTSSSHTPFSDFSGWKVK